MRLVQRVFLSSNKAGEMPMMLYSNRPPSERHLLLGHNPDYHQKWRQQSWLKQLVLPLRTVHAFEQVLSALNRWIDQIPMRIHNI